jgi:phage terminase large subunit-like protein
MPEYMYLREYYENIVKLGKTFKREWIQYGKVPPLREIKYLLTYLDPGFKDTKTSDTKSTWLIGLYKGKFYIIKGFVDRASVSKMVEWHYDLDAYIKNNNAAARMWMEEVFLQDLLFKDFDAGAKQFGYPLPLKGDTRKKPDKDSRIESISGFFEKGHVIFNEEEKDNHNMQRLVSQFLMFQMGVKTPKDGPDSIEGGFFKLREMVINEPDPIFGKLNLNNKKF